jgi:hypothetical protein
MAVGKFSDSVQEGRVGSREYIWLKKFMRCRVLKKN